MAEDQRRMQDEQRRREEEARLEAIRQSEIEKGRAEHEQRARMEAMTVQQEHERKLAALNQDEGKKRLRNIIAAGATVVVLGSALTGYFWYQNKIEQEQKSSALAAEAARAKEDAEKKQRELEAKLAQIKELEDQIGKAADPAEIERLKRQLNEAKDDAKGLGGPRVGGPRPGAPAPAAPKTCAPGDPLCSDI
jgi:colicin import membrane protein